jgi:hypothetical protein
MTIDEQKIRDPFRILDSGWVFSRAVPREIDLRFTRWESIRCPIGWSLPPDSTIPAKSLNWSVAKSDHGLGGMGKRTAAVHWQFAPTFGEQNQT